MDTARTPVVERIARVLAGCRLSVNGEGDDAHAAARVDAIWSDYRDEAIAVLKTLREPDEVMARVGDAAMWERMVLAALEDS